MRPRLLADVRFVAVKDGVYMQSDLDACTLTGQHSHAWLTQLAPLLTGEHTMEELTASLPAPSAQMVKRLVEVLVERRFVVDAGRDQPHTLTLHELAVYAPELSFIRYGFDAAEARFEVLRQATIALVGTGRVLAALVEAGLGSGWRQVCTVGAASGELAGAIARGRRDEAQSVRACAQIPDGADVVLQVYDGQHAEGLLRVSRLCAERRIALGQLWVRKTEGWLSLVSAKAGTSASTWRRLTEPPGRRGEAPDAEDVDWLTGAVPAVLATQLALSCFEHLTGMACPVDRLALTCVDLRTLDTRRHRVHPLTVTAGSRRMGESPREAPLTGEELLKRSSDYIDPRTGVLGEVDEGDLAQVPLAVCRARVSDPNGVLGPGAMPEVIGWGRDPTSARLRAVLAGLATYQALLAERKASAPYRAPVGVAAGLSWRQAVTAGLTQQCQALLGGSDRATHPLVAPLDDPEIARLLALLQAAQEPAALRDLTAVLGVPAYTAGSAAPACAATPQVAMRRALEHLLLTWQARTNNQPCYSEPVALWPDDDDSDDCGDDDGAVERLTRALTAVGRPPTALPLRADAEVARLLPHVVRVVCDE